MPCYFFLKHRSILHRHYHHMKIKLIITLCLFILALQKTNAQSDTATSPKPIGHDTSYWQKGALLNLNFSQVYLSNWAGGGQNSLSLGSLVSSYANYEKKSITWKNSLDLGFGLAKVGDKNASFKKTDDKIVLVSKFGIKQTEKLRYSALLDFRTQFAPGYSYYIDTMDGTSSREAKRTISNILAPAYVITGIGLEYDPVKNLYIYFSPLTVRTTLVLDKALSDAGAFGVKPGERARYQLGYYFTTKYKLEVWENITYSTTLNLFASYKTPDQMVVLWENILGLKVNKYVNVTFTTNLFYDQVVQILRKDGTVGSAIQYKQVLAAGLNAKF
jgi:hypothetical protein